MDKLTFKKGNLFNGINGEIDSNLIDSSQYDLEITKRDEKNYYRVRFEESFYTAHEVKFDSFHVPSYNKYGNSILEVANFRRTQYFKNIFPYYREFNKQFNNEDKNLPEYYAFFQRIMHKNNINKFENLYRFAIPAIGKREKTGVLGYELEIELIRRRYYAVFYIEIMKKGYIQREVPQYIIYDKKQFNLMKNNMENEVLELAINGGYPLKLLEYLYIMTDGDVNLIDQFFNELPKFKSYGALLNSCYLPLIRPSIQENSKLERELAKYFNGDQEDINYSFNNQSKVLIK